MVWACVAVRVGCVESTTVTVKLKVPAAVGVPVIAPVEGASVRPGGRVPPETDQVNGGVPPSTVKMSAEYAVHSVPGGSGVHDIWTAPTMFLFGCQPLKVLQINVTFVDTCVEAPEAVQWRRDRSCRRIDPDPGSTGLVSRARCGRPRCWRS